MKRLAIVFFSVALARLAGATVFTSSANPNAIIPDGNFSGIQSTLTLTGLSGSISDVNVMLDVTGGFNGDFYAYLYHDGASAVLLNRVGRSGSISVGYPDAGFGANSAGAAFTFDDQAGLDVHSYRSSPYSLNVNGQLTGVWQPDGRNIDPTSAGSVFDSASRSSMFSLYNGMDPNGTWSLYIADLSPGGEGVLSNWGVEIAAVPEPGVCAFALVFVISSLMPRRWRFR